jgi:hypothetical protein
MRLGILEIGGDANISSLVEALRSQDIDVITNETAVVHTGDALREGARIGRADCDGVLLVFVESSATALVLPAIMHIACPLVLFGHSDAVARAGMELAHQKIPFDDLTPDDTMTPADALSHWLAVHKKTARQAGIEAAHKLYGLRLAVPETALSDFDRHRFFHHFGIVLVSLDEDAEIRAEDGDALLALTAHLLQQITKSEPQLLSAQSVILAESTLVRLIPADGELTCYFHHVPEASEIVPMPWKSPLDEFGLYESGVVVTGDWRAAIKAACHTLDVAPVDSTGA